jgi:hypothetical protein
MSATKLVLLPLVIVIALGPILGISEGKTGDEQKRAEQIIHSFMEAQGIDIQPGTEDYTIFMREIVWNEYPELTGKDSDFVKDQDELDCVLDYAWNHSGYKELRGGFGESDVEEAELLPKEFEQEQVMSNQSSSSGARSNAIAYAYRWSTSGGTSRNPAYPDFGADDCTNFVSQAMEAGSFLETGSGDGCKHESTNTEWYANPNPSPPLWCTGDFRNWEWSTSWSVPWPFRDYFAHQNSYATEIGWTTDSATAKYHLSLGDVVQLQYNDNGNWTSFHTMIATYEDSSELYVTYHSNAGGYDEVDKALSSISLGSNRFMLVRIKYPKLVYLPLVMKRWPPIPDTPVLNAIYNPNGTSSYTVSWNPADLASTYILQEATNASFSGAVPRYSGSGTSWMATGKAPGTYYYRVKARNSWGDSGWSNTQQTTVWPTTTTFDSVADAMVRSGYPTSNYGSRSYMQAGYAGSFQARRSLVQFDLLGIPSGTPIGQAKLWLYVYYSYDPPGTTRAIATYRVTSSWVEGNVTWNTRPGYGGMYGYTYIPHDVDGWYSIDVTNLVREWINGQYFNYGVWIFGNESPSDPNYRSFYIRDSSTGLEPYLEITYGEGMGASSSRTGEEIVPVSPLAIPEAPAVPEMPRSPLPVPEP